MERRNATGGTTEIADGEIIIKDRSIWRDKLALWMLGLSNKFGFIVMLAASQDILRKFMPLESSPRGGPIRHVSEYSTGLILLLDIVPAYLVQFCMINIPRLGKSIHSFSLIFSIASYSIMAFAESAYLMFFSIGLTSLAYGIGDWTLSTYSALYPKKVRNKWQESMNAAGTWGSLYYAVLCQFKASFMIIFLVMLALPLVSLLLLWLLLRSPQLDELNESPESSEFPLSIFNVEPPLLFFEDKFIFVMHLLGMMLPLGLVILLQHFINQGLYEFVYFNGYFIDLSSQFRWYNVVYQVGLYACLTTKHIVQVNSVWIWAFMQLIVSIFFVCETIFFFTPFLWFVFLLVYCEGIFSGAAYANTIERIFAEDSPSYIHLSETVLKHLVIICTIIGGTISIFVHQALYLLPEPSRPN